MAREIMPISQPDPEVLQAHDTVRKILRDFHATTDPLTKQVFGKMLFDAIDYERELVQNSPTRQAVKNLHEIQNPAINLN